MLENKIRALIRDRRAQLWVCQRYDLLPGQQPHGYDLPIVEAGIRYRQEENSTDTGLISLYWGAIWFEGASSPLLRILRRQGAAESKGRALVLLASDADARADLPYQEYLAAFMLPGLLDGPAGGDGTYGSLGKTARGNIAWNLAKRLSDFPGSLLVIVGATEPGDLEFLWEVLADIRLRDLTILLAWTGEAKDIAAPKNAVIDFNIFKGDTAQLLSELLESGAPKAGKCPESIVRVGDRSVSLANSATRFILKRFALLGEYIFSTPSSLSLLELEDFFDGSLDDWACFSLDVLPVPRSYKTDIGVSLEEDVLQGLRRLATGSTGSRSLVYQLPCTAASGATTLMRLTAYNCARAGFPTLVAKTEQVEINIEDLLSFVTSLYDASLSQGVKTFPPILIILDVEHIEQTQTLARQLAQSLTIQGRRAMILYARRAESVHDSVQKRTDRWVVLPVLTSATDDNEVKACWEHFTDLSRTWDLTAGTQSLEDWQLYKKAMIMRGPNGTIIPDTLFWVALRFFVCEGTSFLDQDSLRESLSKWITKRTNNIANEVSRRLLQNIAVLSSYRLLSPLMTVLRPISGISISSNIVMTLRYLKDIIEWKDASELDDQALMFRHPSIADEYLRSVGIISNEQKLEILSPMLRALSTGGRGDRWVAEEVSARVLAPADVRGVHDWDWRLRAFESIPPIISQGSKAILHHWARCLYGSANEHFLSHSDRLKQYEMAITKLEQARDMGRRPGRDEHPAHIANTLGVAYYELASFLQSLGEEARSEDAWESACKSFERAITLLPSDNVISYLAFAHRLLGRAHMLSDGETLQTPEATRDVAQALALLDRAEEALAGIAAPDPSWSTDIADHKSKALALLSDTRAKAYIKQLKASPNPGLAFYCQTRLALGDRPSQSKITEGIQFLEQAIADGSKIGRDSLRLLAFLMRTSRKHEFDFSGQMAVYRLLDKEVGGRLSDLVDMFRLAVLCYQIGSFSEGADRFRRIREQARQLQSTFAPPKLADYWRDDSGNPRPTVVRVDKAISDWRGEGYVDALGQTIPLRPRHFTPVARPKEYRDCIIRFEIWGPLAVPPSRPER